MVNRREFLKRAAAGGVAVAGGGAFAAGTVNGCITAAGKPMRDVVVTDGLNCTETAADGTWRLPVRDGARFVSVTVPSGWKLPLHYLRYEGTARSYDFSLQRWEASDPGVFRLMHIGDSEITNDRPIEREWIARAKKWADEENCAFIVHTGDICGKTGLENHIRLMNSANMGRPVFYVLGNHDIVFPERGERLFEELYGPCWHSFDAGGVHFIVTPMMRGDGKVSFTVEDIVAWLRNDLAIAKRKNQPVMLLTHGCYDTGIYGMKDFYNRTDMTTLTAEPLDMIAACDFKAIIHGHLHSNYFRRTDDGRVEVASVAPPQKGGATLQLIEVAADRRLKVTNRYGPKERWDVTLSAPAGGWIARAPGRVSYSAPCVSGGRLFVGTCDLEGRGGAGVTAFDSATGRRLWHVPMRDSVHTRLHCRKGLVYAFDCYWGVHALEAATGREVWFRDMRVEFGMDKRAPGWGGNPLSLLETTLDAATNRLYVGSAMTYLAALDLDTGKTVWRAEKKGMSFGRSPAACGVAEGVVVASCNWVGLFGYDARSGALLWRHPGPDNGKLSGAKRVSAGYPWMNRVGRPLIREGKVYLAAEDQLIEMDLKTGEVVRNLMLGTPVRSYTQPVLHDGRFYFGTTRKGLACVDAKDFRLLWTAPVKESLFPMVGYIYPPIRALSSIPVFHEGLVWGTCEDGALYAWDPETGAERRRIDTGAPYVASLTVAEGRLYAADFEGYLRAFPGKI